MKKFISLLLMLFPLLALAQSNSPQFYGGFEYYKVNSVRLREDLPATTGYSEHQITHEIGKMNIICGIRYDVLRFLEFNLKTDTYFDPIRIDRYSPVQANYTVAATVYYRKLALKTEHLCIHPINVDGYIHTQLYGGYTKTGVYYNFK